MKRSSQTFFALAWLVLLAGCGVGRPVQRAELPTSLARTTTPESAPPKVVASGTEKPRSVPETKRGGYYQDDGPAATIPENIENIPDAEPKLEPLNRGTARPYVVFGKAYTPHTVIKPFKQRGVASWYGKKFHGQKTSSGEPYDMFAMTAAHTVLPIPSYVRVSNPANGRSVVVRVNDRGPFHADRIIDLSYTAAQKLGYIGRGSTEVEIEQIIPGEPGSTAYAQAGSKKPESAAAPATSVDELAVLIGRLESPAEKTSAANTKASEAPAGVYLQLGAFGHPDNAENFRGHMTRDLDWVEEDIRVFASNLPNGNSIHRVQIGPYASRSQAEKAAERIREAVGAKPALVTR